MVAVLADGDVDREGDRVAPAWGQLVRSKRRLDAATAAARVLLALVALDHEPQRDGVDLVALLVLALHLVEAAAAVGARLVRVVELVLDLDDRQLRLLRGTVSGPLLPLAVTLAMVVAVGARATRLRVRGALLRGGSEHLLGQLRQVPLQRGKAHLLEGRVTLGLGQLRDQLLDLFRERVDVLRLKLDHLVQDLGVLLLIEPRHARDDEDARSSRQAVSPMNRV